MLDFFFVTMREVIHRITEDLVEDPLKLRMDGGRMNKRFHFFEGSRRRIELGIERLNHLMVDFEWKEVLPAVQQVGRELFQTALSWIILVIGLMGKFAELVILQTILWWTSPFRPHTP